MGVADREYMRDIPVYRDSVRGRSGSWALAGAALVSLAVGGTVLRAPLHLVRSGHHTTVLLPGHHTFPLAGPTVVRTGDVMTERGNLAAGVSGTIIVIARWNGGSWVRLASAHSDANGAYLVRFPLDQPGTVDLRLELPNGDEGITRIAVSRAAVGSSAWPTPSGTA
jgi:uncharacterized Zn-binding protein involved in type VI secretion